MFMRVYVIEVIRFGKLFVFPFPKSCPFWKTEIGCKGT